MSTIAETTTAAPTAASPQLIDFTDAAVPAIEETMPTAEEEANEAANQFPDDDDDDDEDAAIHWRDVPRYTWLCIMRTREVKVGDKAVKY